MGNGVGVSAKVDSAVLNVDQAVEKWATKEVRKATKAPSSVKVSVEGINWDRVAIKHTRTVYLKPSKGSNSPQGVSTTSSEPRTRTTCTVLHDAAFENVSGKEKVETYEAEEVATSTASFQFDGDVVFSQGFKLFPPAEIEIINKTATFDLMSDGGAAARDRGPGTSRGQGQGAGTPTRQQFTFNQLSTWKCKQSVSVKPWSRLRCKLAVEKYQASGVRFQHRVDLVGDVEVMVSLSTTGEMKTVSGSIRDILLDKKHMPQVDLGRGDTGIQLLVTGLATFDYGVKESVQLQNEPLDKSVVYKAKQEEEAREKENAANLLKEQGPPRQPQYASPKPYIQQLPTPQPLAPLHLLEILPSTPSNLGGHSSQLSQLARTSVNYHNHHLQKIPLSPCAISLADDRGICTVIISTGTRLPATASYTHPTKRYFRDRTVYHVYQGDYTEAHMNGFIGSLELMKEVRTSADLKIVFRLDANGELDVTARDANSGRRDDFTFRIKQELNLVSGRRY